MISRWGAGPYILMYHSIAEGSDDPYTVPPNRFQDQVSWLVEHGFEFLPLSYLVKVLKDGDYKNLRNKVAITFDDGYRDFLTDALPVLLHYKVPATVFIVAGMLGSNASWSENSKHAQLMTEDEIRHISSQGINLGSHTMTHANLVVVDQEVLLNELEESRSKLRELGESFYPLSYPWGQWCSRILDAVIDSGYDCAMTVGGKMRPRRTDIYCLPRLAISGDMDIRAFKSLFDRQVVKNAKRVSRVLRRFFPEGAASENIHCALMWGMR